MDAERVRQIAREFGFDLVGIAPADDLPDPHAAALATWLAAGRHGEMAYMARDPARRGRPRDLLPGARSVIALAINYYPGEHESPETPPEARSAGRSQETGAVGAPRSEPDEAAATSAPERDHRGACGESARGARTKYGDAHRSGKVARYAWGADYHQVLETRLDRLEEELRRETGPGFRARRFVDHGPLLERAIAQQAGLGFIGKNTCLITPQFGSWVLLAELITNLELPPDPPGLHQCGSCRLCIDVCPTGALVEPFVLDSRRCISYLTIELKAPWPEEAPDAAPDGWAFGCDVCQEVCPYNRRPSITSHPELRSSMGAGAWIGAEEIDGLDESGFRARYRHTPLTRPKLAGLKRNLALLKSLRCRVEGEP